MRDATWRVGRKVKRTVYIGDDLVGLMDTPELADEVVRAVNNRRMVESAGRDIRADRDRLRSELARERETNADIRAGWDKALSTAEEAMSERNLARAERDQFKAERDKAYHDYKLVRAENADLCQKERALLDTTLSALVAARMFGAGNESGWQTEVETAIDQVSARLASLGEKPCSAVPETQGWNADGQLKCELPGNHNGPHQCRGGVFKWDKAYVPPPAESQPVQVREEAARRLRAAASALPVELNCTGISLRRLAQWLEEQRPPVDTPARDAVARALVPAEVDNPVRIADRLQGFKAVQVLRELTQWRSDFHAIDITRGSGRFSRVKEALVELEFIADRAVRVLGETK